MITLKSGLTALLLLAPGLHLCPCGGGVQSPAAVAAAQKPEREPTMQIQYLEIVTADVDATCSVLAKVHGVAFGEPDARLGNARTAALKGGGLIGVRASMAEHDKPIVRPYMLVGDAAASEKDAKEAGGEIAMGAMPIPDHGKFAIYFVHGTQFGLWESLPADGAEKTKKEERAVEVQYLEIVSSDVEPTCSALSQVHGITFGKPDAALGNARLADLTEGGQIGVRASMAEHDVPIVRPYLLVDDIEAATQAAEKAGGEFAMKGMEIPGHGKFAIYFVAGTQFGLWENAPKEGSR